MQRLLPGVSQTLFAVPGFLRLQWDYLRSFWQCDQHDCTGNTLDVVLVEVTEVGWISDLGVESSGPVVGYTRLSAGRIPRDVLNSRQSLKRLLSRYVHR